MTKKQLEKQLQFCIDRLERYERRFDAMANTLAAVADDDLYDDFARGMVAAYRDAHACMLDANSKLDILAQGLDLEL